MFQLNNEVVKALLLLHLWQGLPSRNAKLRNYNRFTLMISLVYP